MKICFIGFGNMAKAIAESLCRHERSYEIVATAPSLKAGKTAEGIITNPDNLVGIADADLVFLAVKPAKMAEVLAQIKAKLSKNCLLISVAAGLSLEWLEKHCPQSQALIRSMPNIAIKVEKGATPLIANRYVTEEQKKLAEALFHCSGLMTWTTNEQDLDSFTALSGSGPAYVFLFMEAMIAAATKMGLNEQLAKEFTLQTVRGAVDLALDSGLPIEELRRKVTSPAGTTAAALAIFEAKGFREIIAKAMEAAKARADELGSL